MKSLKQRRDELRREAQKRRTERVKANAVEIVNVPILGAFGLTNASVPNLPSTSGMVAKGQEMSLELGDTFLKQYKKVTLTNAEKLELRQEGFSPLRSSNIQGVAVDGNDLLLRFHSGETYKYPNKSGFYKGFNEALSPGRFLWQTIRYARGYTKI